MKINVKLTKNDGDLIGWKNFLPRRSFSETMNRILVIERDGRIARIPCEFSSAEIKEGDNFSFYIADEKAFELLSSMEKGTRSSVIKSIIRKHIDENRKCPPGVIHLDLLQSTVAYFRSKIGSPRRVARVSERTEATIFVGQTYQANVIQCMQKHCRS